MDFICRETELAVQISIQIYTLTTILRERGKPGGQVRLMHPHQSTDAALFK
jgi:hypothetical protein